MALGLSAPGCGEHADLCCSAESLEFCKELDDTSAAAESQTGLRYGTSFGLLGGTGLLIGAGAAVAVVGLKGLPELNGQVGTAIEFNHTTERWRVDLGDHGIKALRLENLELPADVARSSADPLLLRVGSRVVLVALKAARLNDLQGTVIGFDSVAHRWRVDLGRELGVKALKECNLELLHEDWAGYEGPTVRAQQYPHSSPRMKLGIKPRAAPAEDGRRTLCRPKLFLFPAADDVPSQDSVFEASLLPTREMPLAAEQCMRGFSKIAKRLGAQCVLKGSWAQETAMRYSDLDVALVFPGQFEVDSRLGKAEKVQLLQSFMARADGLGVHKTEEVFGAREPILRLEYSRDAGQSKLEVDLAVGNSSSGMLDDWIRERIAKLQQATQCVALIRLVKCWVAQRKIHKALFGFLNSLSWTLLVLVFVECNSPLETVTRDVFYRFLDFVRSFGAPPDLEKKLSVDRSCWMPRVSGNEDAQSVLWIEDPTKAANNTSRSLRLKSWQLIHEELHRAVGMYKSGEPLEAICGCGAPRIELAPPHLQAELREPRLGRLNDNGQEPDKRQRTH